jgi:hypothetical protein
MGIIKKHHDKKWTLQFLTALYNSIDIALLLINLEINYLKTLIFSRKKGWS